MSATQTDVLLLSNTTPNHIFRVFICNTDGGKTMVNLEKIIWGLFCLTTLRMCLSKVNILYQIYS